MRLLLSLFAAVFLFAPALANAQLVSCEGADDWAGKIICNDTELSIRQKTLDKMLGEVSALLEMGERSDIQLAQANWRNALSSCRTISEKDGITPKDCLLESYDQRIGEVQKMLAPAEAVLSTAEPVPPMSLSGPELLAAPAGGQEKYPVAVTDSGSKMALDDDQQIDVMQEAALASPPLQLQAEVPVTEAPSMAAGRIALPAGSRALEECHAEGLEMVQPCLGVKLADAEVALQMAASRLEMALREMDIVRVRGVLETRFSETQQDFGRFRESHCQWLGSLAGEDLAEDLYTGCFIDLTVRRAAELQTLYALIR